MDEDTMIKFGLVKKGLPYGWVILHDDGWHNAYHSGYAETVPKVRVRQVYATGPGYGHIFLPIWMLCV